VDYQSRILGHLDLDMFYASVEIRENPELRGKPLIVGNPNARKTKKGVVLTCSYEAREFGVRSGMPMNEALQRCPNAEISSSSRSKYSQISKNIMSILQDLDIPIKITSIDEAYLDLTHITHNYTEAGYIAKIIKEEIFKREEITCSIGIAPTLTIAKMASDYNKPDAITVVSPDLVHSFFSTRDLTKIPGIGKKSGARFQSRGIENCATLIGKSRPDLVAIMGRYGNYLYDLFNCRTRNYIRNGRKRKSISHERTFHGKPGDISTYESIINNLFDRTYSSLVNKKFLTKTVSVKLRFNDFETITRAKSLVKMSSDVDELFIIVKELTGEFLEDPRGLRLIGVSFSNLVRTPEYEPTTISKYFNQ
jgi:nucleotidyltransferase/DNA polymerase involved in DNA repair